MTFLLLIKALITFKSHRTHNEVSHPPDLRNHIQRRMGAEKPAFEVRQNLQSSLNIASLYTKKHLLRFPPFPLFLVANKRLYIIRVCPSVGRSVGPLVMHKSDLTSINTPAQRSRLIMSCMRTCFSEISSVIPPLDLYHPPILFSIRLDNL